MTEFTNLMKALSDSNRVRALIGLKNGELCVCQIMELLGLAISTVSKHMSILKQAKLVQSRKSGRWVYYRLSDSNKSARDLTEFAIKELLTSETIKEDTLKLKQILKLDIEELCRNQRGEKCCPKGVNR